MPGRHLILYDGLCVLCNRSIRFVLKHDSSAVFRFAPLQSRLAQSLPGTHQTGPDGLHTLFVIVDYESASPTLLSKSRAALFVLKNLGGPWRLAGVLRILPGALLDWVYDLIARNRYRVFGRYDRCLLPSPEQRSRFIDF